MKTRKKIPTFKDEDAEREFWATADSTEYIDWSRAQPLVTPSLRPTVRTISLRLPESMIAELKLLANQRDVPYQSLLKVFLADRLKQERTGSEMQKKVSGRKRAG
jgi:predicted DNA binding CopG/RHH family protein